MPLTHDIEQHVGTGVRFTCASCMAGHHVPMEQVLKRLKDAGLGDETTGVRAIGGEARAPCRQSGVTRSATMRAWGVCKEPRT